MRRLSGLLILTILNNIGCNKVNQLDVSYENENTNHLELDSTIVKIKVPGNEMLSLNFRDRLHSPFPIDINNTTHRDREMMDKIPMLTNDQVMLYIVINNTRRDSIFFEFNYYLIKARSTELLFELDADRTLKIVSKESFKIDNLFEEYQRFAMKIENSKEEKLTKQLRTIFQKNNRWISGLENDRKKTLEELNKYLFYSHLQKIDSENEDVDAFIQQINGAIPSPTLSELIFEHVKNRIDVIDFKKLNENNFTSNYINLFSHGLLLYLRQQDNKGKNKHKASRLWLKSTAWFRENKSFLEKELRSLDEVQFKSMMKELTLIDTSLVRTSLAKVIDMNPFDFYLIDFWASWCKPCIEGAKIMTKKDIPPNVGIISLSLDRPNKIKKWKNLTKELNQEISYLINEDRNLKAFVDSLNLKSLPRYIIVDKSLNLIDESFLAPHDPEFSPSLTSLE
ncbi:MAG: thioredoxin-like domain-containing protein [Bacteroidota bacterium]